MLESPSIREGKHPPWTKHSRPWIRPSSSVELLVSGLMAPKSPMDAVSKLSLKTYGGGADQKFGLEGLMILSRQQKLAIWVLSIPQCSAMWVFPVGISLSSSCHCMLLMEERRLSFTICHTFSMLLLLSRKILPFLSFHMHHMVIPGKAFHIVLMILFLNALWF